MKRVWLLLTILGIGLASGCGPEVMVAKDFEVESVQSASIKTTLKSKRGKVVLIDFWATWCGPCKMISPVVEDLYQQHRAKGLEVMAITDEDRKTVLAAERRSPHKVPVYIDTFRISFEAFGVQSLPSLVVIDREGKIAYASSGFSDATPGELEAAVKKALG